MDVGRQGLPLPAGKVKVVHGEDGRRHAAVGKIAHEPGRHGGLPRALRPAQPNDNGFGIARAGAKDAVRQHRPEVRPGIVVEAFGHDASALHNGIAA